ncbi:host attachment protein [Akkermansiaceae bacterium]|nr:host attachment protein [Akkermansiaceae bacterium]
MNQLSLKKHLIALATLPETESPVISAYFDAGLPRQENRIRLNAWAAHVRHCFRGTQLRDFDDALEEVSAALEMVSGGMSAAIFCRWGETPMVLPLVLKVPLEPQFHARTVPVIFPLVEAKDRFHRFVLVVSSSESARVYEINLGDASEALLAERPELRERLGREWTREHYQNHRRERDGRFVKEKVAVIESLMAKRGHNALVLAGEPRFINRLREQLPKHLQSRIAGEIHGGVTDCAINHVVQQSVSVFLQQENMESHDTVRRLESAVLSGGLAVLGYGPTLRAIESHQADQLVISSDLPTSDRERLVHLAMKQDIPVETVRNSETLAQNGGVGCLLRYLMPDSGSALLNAV